MSRARIPRPRRPFANSSGVAPAEKRGGTPLGVSTTSARISMAASIWMRGSSRPVRKAFTSMTSPTLTPRNVTGAPRFRPLTEPGK